MSRELIGKLLMKSKLKVTLLILILIPVVSLIMLFVNGAIVARVQFIDEYLLECIATGFKQLVIIGAGFDTRAYRFEGVKENLKVFEVDHPVTQKVKVDKIKEIFENKIDKIIMPNYFSHDLLLYNRL